MRIKYDFVLSQLKIPKTTSLGISKMWSIIFSPSKLTEISGNLAKFQLIKNQQNCKNVKKVDHILESPLDIQSYFDSLYVISQLSQIKDDIQVVSQFPCLLGHPVR